MLDCIINFFTPRGGTVKPQEDQSPTSILVRLMASKMIMQETKIVARRPSVLNQHGSKVRSNMGLFSHSLPVSDLRLDAQCNPFINRYRLPGENVRLRGLYYKGEKLILSSEDEAFLDKTLIDLNASELKRVEGKKKFKSEQRAIDAIAQTLGVPAPPMLEEQEVEDDYNFIPY